MNEWLVITNMIIIIIIKIINYKKYSKKLRNRSQHNQLFINNNHIYKNRIKIV